MSPDLLMHLPAELNILIPAYRSDAKHAKHSSGELQRNLK